MKPWLFISDLHLSPERTAIIDLFLRFTEEVAPQAERLYILGDFVEYWIGDDDQAQGLQAAFDALKRLSEQDINIYFMAGNRDFLVGEQLARRCGFQRIDDPTIETFEDEALLLMHGDSLCTDDVEYQRFRTMVRDSQWQQDFLSRPIAEREAIARSMRDTSKQANSVKDEFIMDVNQQAVETAMRKYDSRLLIHGHTHRGDIHDFSLGDETVKRVVLNDWYETGSYLLLENTTNIRLENFS